MNDPQGIAVDPSGNVYIADEDNHRVRQVTTDGVIHTIAGTGVPGFSGDGGPATAAAVNLPEGVAAGPGGVIYFVDSGNKRIRTLTPPAAVRPGGVVTASDFGGFSTIAPGSWIEIYGNAFSATTRSWTGADFTGSTAPSNLSGVSVTIGGAPAFLDFISPSQINAQAPSGLIPGQQDLVVTGPNGSSAPYSVTVASTKPGLLAPSSFKIGSVAYVAVRPDSPAGQIVPASNSLVGSFHLQFGGTDAAVIYDGLAPQAVGLYQFNVVVPAVASNDAAPVTFTLDGTPGTQTFYVPIQGN